MNKLALTLPLARYESATSFASRLAALNGCVYVQDFCSDMGLNWKRIVKCDHNELKELAKLSGADYAEMLKHTAKVVSTRRYELNGEVLTPICHTRGRQPICPKCLEDDLATAGPYGRRSRSHWNISQIRHCPKHKVELIVLPAVDYPRDPHDFAARLRDAKLGNYPLCPGKPTEFETYLSRRVEGKSTSLWLDEIDFDAVASFCEVLGVLMAHGERVRPEQLSVRQLSEAANQAYLTCLDGSEGIQQALSGIQRRSTSERPGAYTDFGPFFCWLSRRQNCPRHTVLIGIVRNFIWTNYPVAKGETVLGKPCPERRLHSGSSASLEYGICNGRMYAIQRELAAKAGFPAEHSNRFYLNVAEHSELLWRIANGLRRVSASAFLGCSGSTFDRIVVAGLITPTLRLAKFTESYPKAELQRLIDGCMFRLADGKIDPNEFEPIRAAIRKTKLSFIDVIRLLSNGDVHYMPPETGPANLGSIRVNWRELRQQFGDEWPAGYTKQKLKRILRVNDSTVSHLTREKYIVGKMFVSPRTGLKRTIFSQSDVDRFLGEYVTLGILAHGIGTQAKHVSARLDKLGIHPLQFPQQYSKIYRRAEVDGVV